MQGLEKARALYESHGRAMLEREFPEYVGRITVGLAGHGSECLGYDDELSEDHDFEKGFCLWIDDETDREIGVALSRAYRRLPIERAEQHSALAERCRGVIRISDFFRRYTGSEGAPESWQQWMALPSYALCEACSGEVWRDDCGKFSAIRQRIRTGMPEDVRRKKLAARLVIMAQAGQYNYSRCIAHGESGAAMLAAVEFVNAACGAVYLLNRAHMPYYKWQLRGMGELEKLSQLREALEFLLLSANDTEGQRLKAGVIEDICAETIREVRAQGLSDGGWDYLEPHALSICEHITIPELRAMHVMEG